MQTQTPTLIHHQTRKKQINKQLNSLINNIGVLGTKVKKRE